MPMRPIPIPTVCARLARMKFKAVLALVASVILLYLIFQSYIFCCQTPSIDTFPRHPNAGEFDGRNIYHLDHAAEETRSQGKANWTCREQRNFVFIKGMKCATSTLLGVFYRFGYTRNLSFVSPLMQRMYLNWPFPMTMRDFRPSSRGYNILTDHSIYTEDVMEAIMPKDTVYIGIIREPFAHVKSIFQYFKIAKISGVPSDVENPIVEYFSNLEKYESAYKSHDAKERWCIPDDFSMTRNLMSHCHGMPVGFPPGTRDISNDMAAVDQYIQHLDTKFNLIMIVEYFYESLILLRRRMCWKFKDIVHINVNVAKYGFNKDSPVPEHIVDVHRKWDSADYRLYNYFNNTFWKNVSRQGPRFYSEVETFKRVEAQVQSFCQGLYDLGKKDHYPANMTETIVEETEWNERFSITAQDCWMLGPNPYEMIHLVQKENDVNEVKLLEEQKKIFDNRTMKSMC